MTRSGHIIRGARRKKLSARAYLRFLHGSPHADHAPRRPRLAPPEQRDEGVREVREPRGGDPAVRRRDRRHRAVLERVGHRRRPRDLRRHVPADRDRDHRRLPPAAHPPRLSDLSGDPLPARRARGDGRAGSRDRLGRRPPQAPRPHRRRGRPALPARRPRRRAQGRAPRPLAFPHRLADGLPRPGRLATLRPRSRRGSRACAG